MASRTSGGPRRIGYRNDRRILREKPGERDLREGRTCRQRSPSPVPPAPSSPPSLRKSAKTTSGRPSRRRRTLGRPSQSASLSRTGSRARSRCQALAGGSTPASGSRAGFEDGIKCSCEASPFGDELASCLSDLRGSFVIDDPDRKMMDRCDAKTRWASSSAATFEIPCCKKST